MVEAAVKRINDAVAEYKRANDAHQEARHLSHGACETTLSALKVMTEAQVQTPEAILAYKKANADLLDTRAACKLACEVTLEKLLALHNLEHELLVSILAQAGRPAPTQSSASLDPIDEERKESS